VVAVSDIARQNGHRLAIDRRYLRHLPFYRLSASALGDAVSRPGG